MVYEAMMKANPNEKLVQLKSLETLKEVANGEANKVFIPFEATNTLSSLGAIKEVLQRKKRKNKRYLFKFFFKGSTNQ
jgi:SPFH domain, Band 7 family protein